MRRRAVLATLGTGVFAGCSSINALGGPSFEKAPADAVTNPKELHRGDENKSGSSAKITLEKEQYFASGFAWPDPFRFRVTGQVMENGPVDIYLMSNDRYNNYQKQPQLINAVVEAEGLDSIDIEENIDPGQYQLVIDNTNLGGVEPSGTAVVQFRAEVLGQGTPTPTPQQ